MARSKIVGLVFLKYISNAFQKLYDRLAADKSSDPENRDRLKLVRQRIS